MHKVLRRLSFVEMSSNHPLKSVWSKDHYRSVKSLSPENNLGKMDEEGRAEEVRL